jgi:hypothetical protein
MCKRFPNLEALATWLNGPERGEFEIEYIVREGSLYLVMIHPVRKAA